MRDFSVSVCMITYNHESFIAQAIEGVMMQQTDFRVQLIIGEDCSTDQTREICREYKSRYPERITLLLPEKNLGGMGAENFLATVKVAADGYRYIAMCEGDDYWIDPLKLQQQVDCAESDPEIGMVYTDIREFHQTSQRFHDVPGVAFPSERVVAELIKQKYIHFPTLLLRADLFLKILGNFSADVQGNVVGDTRLILEFAQNSKVGYVPRVTTVYRIVAGSQSHPEDIRRFIFVSNDTYQTRVNFVKRYNLEKKLLGIPVCNFNRGIVNNAAVNPNFFKSLEILSHLKIADTIRYCDFSTFRAKIDAKIIAKLFSTLIGANALRNYLKNKK